MSQSVSALSAEHPTFVDLLRERAVQYPNQRSYAFLNDGEVEKDHLTCATLDACARAIAVRLQEDSQGGERALLIYPSGLDFITAFFGCLYAAVVAVPVYPPSSVKQDRNLARFRAIANDAQVSLILTTSALASKVAGLLALAPELKQARLIITDDLPVGDHWQRPAIHGETLAFLQYTSGSTGLPKGVMVSHGNLLHNSALVARACRQPAAGSRVVTWLPLYHDLGLIGGILQPLYSGYESIILSPAAFLQRPIRWLQAISRTRATLSAGPNFAYDLCVRKITPEQKETLDLSSWMAAANGAEPVRAETMQRFAEAFEPCGFRREAFLPCYGLAEATLLVCGSLQHTAPCAFDAGALSRNQAVEVPAEAEDALTLVSLGPPPREQRLAVVDPESLTRCSPGEVGEIWVSGPSVAQGYWRQGAETERTFEARLAREAQGLFLRTGDLGFIQRGELYITGRLKDLIIIRGSNHYPQDIERTVELSHTGIRAGSGAAFSVEVGGEERLVVVYEVERRYLRANTGEIVASMRRAIAEEHELQLYAAVLIKTGSMSKTSSGKVQRRACRENYLKQSLEVVYAWSLDDSAALEEREGGGSRREPPPINRTKGAIQDWLVAHVAERLQVDPRAVDAATPLAHYGMDSISAVSLAADLEDWLGREISPTLAYDYPTIDALAGYLVGEAGARREISGHEAAAEAIAIIGIACRFPGAPDSESFWQLLSEGREAITEVPAGRWDLHAYYDSGRATPGKMHTRWGGFLEQVDRFAASFFNISPREAAHMDPQQRILLEVAWEALEHAGLAADKVAGSQSGVFIGISSNDYAHLRQDDPQLIDAYIGTGNAHSIAANRLSYFFDLRGPSIAIDTACSSSLVAVHLACQSLRSGECKMALAGGVNVILTPELSIAFSQAQMMSADGRCKAFDESADGYVRAEGCGIAVLKPLSQALRDGDNVLALIRGSAVNQDGRSNGLTAPNGPAQEAVIRQALHNAGVAPHQPVYVEAHGSSTPLGDPIEFESLKAVLMRDRTPGQVCVLGSVKTNIGHLEAAAGIAGLLKVVLSLQHAEIPPHLNLQTLNRHISLAGTTFELPRERRPWPAGAPRIAGVSAFGFGGTNVHIIVEQAPLASAAGGAFERPAHLLALSAQSDAALKALASRYATFLAAHPAVPLADVCFSADSGRAHFAFRAALTAESAVQMRGQLEALAQGSAGGQIARGSLQRRERPRMVFLFTGQGSQYYGMGRLLYDTQPVFHRVIDRCDNLLRPYLEQTLISVLYPDPGINSPLHETAYTQPALFALEYALAELWRSWGVEPDLVMGHSVGEYVAACVAGAFSLEDGLKLMAERGRLMQALPLRGTMVAIFAEPARVEAALAQMPGAVAIAAVNGPGNTVISGEHAAVQAVQRQLEAEGVMAHPLAVSHAFHSPLMEPMLAAFEQAARSLRSERLRTPLVANLTGKVLNAGELIDAAYWRQQTRGTVQFAAAIRTIAEQGFDLFLELGPASTLLSQGRHCLAENAGTWLPSLQRERDDWTVILHSLGALYMQGLELDWRGFDADYRRLRVSLPTYPFERERFWLEEAPRAAGAGASQPAHSRATLAQSRHPLLDSHTELAHPAATHAWETLLDKQRLPYLNDHRIQGIMALPISVYIEMVTAAAAEAFGQGPHVLKQLELKKMLLLSEQSSQKVQVVFSSDAQRHISFQIFSRSAGVPEPTGAAWTLHASGEIMHV